MKVAIIDNLPDGGAKRVVWEQIRHLSKNHQVLHCTNLVQSRFASEHAAVSTALLFDPDKRSGLARPLADLTLIKYTYNWYAEQLAAITAWGADVVIAHPCQVTQAPLILLQQTEIPLLYFMEETNRVYFEQELRGKSSSLLQAVYELLRLEWLHFFDFQATRRATARTTTSTFVQQAVQKQYNCSSTLIPLGVDTALFQPDARIKPKHFLFVGEQEDVNGFDLLTAALADTNASFPVEFLTFKNKILPLSDVEVVQKYQQSFAVVCLSKHEPFGLAALEGMSCGVPIIAVQEGGYLDTVTSETGTLIDRDAVQLRAAMQRYFSDVELRNQHGEAGRKRVLEQFTWQHHRAQLEIVLSSLVS